jgi:hypothetical protein
MSEMRNFWIMAAVLLTLIFGNCVELCMAEPNAATSQPILYMDLSAMNQLNLNDPAQARRAWDTLHLVASVQGIVNRQKPILFVRFMTETDDFWFNYLREPGNWLAGRKLVKVESVSDLLKRCRPQLKGVVVYDDRVPATSNLASTIAGVEDRVCLRYDPSEGSVYRQVMEMADWPLRKNVVKLMNDDGSPMFIGKGMIPGTPTVSTGSAKCDA